MKKTVLTAVLSISLACLSACQTARLMTAKNTETTPPADRTIAQAPVEGALEIVFKNLAGQVAAGNEEVFDKKVLDIINSNKALLGVTTHEEITMSNLDGNVARPTAFLNRLGRSNLLSGLNVTKEDLMAAATQQAENAQTITVGSTLSIPDLVRPTGPVSPDSFKDAIAAGANRDDVNAIVTAAQSLENKVGHSVVGNGCANLRSPASVHNLEEVVSGTDAVLPKGATQAQVDDEFQAEIAKVTGADAAGAHERLCELANKTRCGVLKIDYEKVCAE